jgi:hypothetical protein
VAVKILLIKENQKCYRVVLHDSHGKIVLALDIHKPFADYRIRGVRNSVMSVKVVRVICKPFEL